MSSPDGVGNKQSPPMSLILVAMRHVPVMASDKDTLRQTIELGLSGFLVPRSLSSTRYKGENKTRWGADTVLVAPKVAIVLRSDIH